MFSFGYNSFWNFNFQGNAAVQSLLTKPDLQLDELLDEDGLLVELKTLNQKLFDFLLTEENFKQLINHVILLPHVDDLQFDQKRCYKFPFVCADVLSSDCQAIVSEFFKSTAEIKQKNEEKQQDSEDQDDEVNLEDVDGAEKRSSASDSLKSVEAPRAAQSLEYLEYLFGFLGTEELNQTAAGYFAKIVNNLYAKKPSALLSYIYESRPVLLQKLTDHIGSKSIAEFLSKLLTFESSLPSNTSDEAYNAERIKILQALIKKLDASNDLEVINNAAFLICEIFGKYNTMHCGHEILKTVLDRPTIDYLFSTLQDKNSTLVCAVALILGNIFAYYILTSTSRQTSDADNDNESDATTGNSQQLELRDNVPLVSAMINNIQTIVNYIGDIQGDTFTNQHGATMVPLGAARLKLIELIIIAMKTNNKQIMSKLAEHGLFETLLNLFLRFEWNNMLHNQTEKIIILVLEGNSEELKAALFEKANILSFIADACREVEYAMSGKHARKIRKGYLGQLVKISNKIVESKDPAILRYTQNSEIWKEHVETRLAEINQKNKIHLGGRDPRGPYEDDSNNMLDELIKLNRGIDKSLDYKQQNDQEEEDDDDQDEADFLKDENSDPHQQDDDDDEEEYDKEYNKEPTQKGYYSIIGRYGKNSGTTRPYHDEEEQEQEYVEENEVEESSPVEEETCHNNETKTEQQKSQEEGEKADYYSNVFWKREDWYSADEVLKEIELI